MSRKQKFFCILLSLFGQLFFASSSFAAPELLASAGFATPKPLAEEGFAALEPDLPEDELSARAPSEQSDFLGETDRVQEAYQQPVILKGEVKEIVSQKTEFLPGPDIEQTVQILKVEILEGKRKGAIVELQNDFIILKEGDKIFLNQTIGVDGVEFYTFKETNRVQGLLFFIGLFVVVYFLFTGKHGIRALLSLLGSFMIIVYFLLPRLLTGASPLLTSIFFAVIILFIVMYVTHGFNRKTTAAFLGTSVSVLLTAFIAYYAVLFTNLSGFFSDEAVFLNIGTSGILNMRGLLLGAIIIGMIGVLDDIAITQASAVQEISEVGKHLSKKQIFTRSLRIGKDHMGASINTLALAYTGASLPLLLLFSMSSAPFEVIVSREIFATELVRTIGGSFGLLFAMPLTTLFAVFFLEKKKERIEKD